MALPQALRSTGAIINFVMEVWSPGQCLGQGEGGQKSLQLASPCPPREPGVPEIDDKHSGGIKGTPLQRRGIRYYVHQHHGVQCINHHPCNGGCVQFLKGIGEKRGNEGNDQIIPEVL